MIDFPKAKNERNSFCNKVTHHKEKRFDQTEGFNFVGDDNI